MFNIVCETKFIESEIDEQIEGVIQAYKGQPFAWWLGPTASPKGLSAKLVERGFVFETTELAMICDLTTFDFSKKESSLDIKRVQLPEDLENFIQVLEPYDLSARPFYERLSLSHDRGVEDLFIGYENGDPVIIGILYFEGNTAGIFSILTREDKRGLGYGTQMMNDLCLHAKDKGAIYATLIASSDSGYRIYERLGFKNLGAFECLEWRGS